MQRRRRHCARVRHDSARHDANGRYDLTHHRVDDDHSCVPAVWRRIGNGAPWPDDSQWATLRAADRLDELHPPQSVEVELGGEVAVEFDLPMPGMSLVEVTPR